MILIAGTIRIEAQHRTEAIAVMTAMMAETMKEEGCVSYDFSADLNDETVFHLFEEWETQEHLEAHFVAPHMAEFRAASADLGERIAEISRYVATEKAAL